MCFILPIDGLQMIWCFGCWSGFAMSPFWSRISFLLIAYSILLFSNKKGQTQTVLEGTIITFHTSVIWFYMLQCTQKKEPKVTYDFFTVSLNKHFWNIITLFFILISEGRLSCAYIMQSLRIPVCRIQSMECLLLLNHVLSLWCDIADLSLFLWGLCPDYWFIQFCIYLHLSSTDSLYFDKP